MTTQPFSSGSSGVYVEDFCSSISCCSVDFGSVELMLDLIDRLVRLGATAYSGPVSICSLPDRVHGSVVNSTARRWFSVSRRESNSRFAPGDITLGDCSQYFVLKIEIRAASMPSIEASSISAGMEYCSRTRAIASHMRSLISTIAGKSVFLWNNSSNDKTTGLDLSHPKNFHHLIAQVVYNLDCDAAGAGFFEGTGSVAVEGGPSVGVDLGFEGGLQGSVGIVLAEEVGVTDEEALFVVVGVDEPTGNTIWAVATDFTRIGMENIDSVDFDSHHATAVIEKINIRFAEDDEEVALAGVFKVVGHVKVRVHPGLEHRDAAEFVELGGHGVEVEGASDKNVESRIARFTSGQDEVLALDGTELGADHDSRAAFGVSFLILAFGAHHLSWPRDE